MNIKMAVEEFLDNVGGNKSQCTKKSYANGVKALQKHLIYKGLETTSPLENLTIDLLISFPSYLGKMGYSKKTIGLYTSSSRSFVRWLIIQGHMNPTQQEMIRFEMAYKDANQRRQDKLPRWPKRDDVERLLDAVKKLNEPSPRLERDIAIIEFLASTGCRNNEICQLKIENINPRDRSAVVVGKGDKERVVFFSVAALDALRVYWKARSDSSLSSPVFCRHDKGAGKKSKPIGTASIRNIVKDVMKVAGVRKFSPHYFRHAFAIKMLRETQNLALVQDLLGHKDPAATRVYAKIYPDELRDAHHKVFG